MESVKIILFCTAAAVIYGILHDQVTAHLCVEYFTIGHPPVFPTTSPFLLALGWGIIATWWVGLPLGVGLALAARVGDGKLALLDLRRGVVMVMLVSAVGALLGGIVGAWLARSGTFPMPNEWAGVLPPGKWVAFMADAGAHEASYDVGALGGLVLIGHTIWRRTRAKR